MKLIVQVPIKGSKEEIWKTISDIENAVDYISGIEKIEIHHKPVDTLLGLRWTETRTLFGKTATETMWIIEFEENSYYKTQAESHGALYLSTLRISEQASENSLSMEFVGKARTWKAKIMAFIFTPFFIGVTKKALYQDLLDIKKLVEEKSRVS